MTTMETLLAEIERESERCRRALELVPEGHYDWKPHERSMIFGYLADMVARIPSWFAMIVTQDSLDLQPPGGPQQKPAPLKTSRELLDALHESVGKAREALNNTTEEHLKTPWRLLVAGQTVIELPRHVMIRDTISHLVHHRGQMTVYLRLIGAKVPALYGPSADERRFD